MDQRSKAGTVHQREARSASTRPRKSVAFVFYAGNDGDARTRCALGFAASRVKRRQMAYLPCDSQSCAALKATGIDWSLRQDQRSDRERTSRRACADIHYSLFLEMEDTRVAAEQAKLRLGW